MGEGFGCGVGDLDNCHATRRTSTRQSRKVQSCA
jgi:hypothetical protein